MSLYQVVRRKKNLIPNFRAISIYHLLFILCAFWSTSVFAIPSPDLLVNLTASAGQALGLLSVVVGGFAYSRKKTRSHKERRSTWRWTSRLILAALLVSIGANVLQYTSQLDAKQQRLQTNLTRSSVENGQKVGDISLKTLSFSDQLDHPQGIHTEQLDGWIQSGVPLNIIDVRETEEIEAGHIKGSWHMRYPDLRENPQDFISEGSRTVLVCYSGNRSSELCNEFTKAGMSCNFMIGGYEKWLSEERPLEMAGERSADQLRELPAFPNKSTLLDTPDVMALLEEEAAIFVDVRYPGDFELGHLPGAINIPVRKLLTAELETQLKALPNQPIIAPCYDKRSCFYGQILGLKLDRLGYDFRGRYSVPHEFTLPRKEKSHVAKWRQNQEGQTLLGLVGATLQSLLEGLNQWTEHLVASILILVLVLRMSFFPLAWKAERDQWVQRNLESEANALKERFKEDKQRASQAVMELYRHNGITPLRNVIGTVIQITLFLVFFSVVNRVSEGSQEGFLWLPSLGETDPVNILPATVGMLLTAYLFYTAKRTSMLFLALYVACGVGIGWLMVYLNAGVNLYLLFSMAFVCSQTAVINYVLKKQSSAKEQAMLPPEELPVGDTIVPLAQSHKVFGTGNKAARLGHMLEAGLPVPDGFAITSQLLGRESSSQSDSSLELLPRESALIDRLWKQLDMGKVAVRSSGLNEDGACQSYAGVFESRLNVTRDDFLDSLDEVRQSLVSLRASAYSGNEDEAGGVLVQKMVDAEYAGVLFTEHPASAGCIMIEMTAGLGESLVSGTVTPEGYRFGSISHQCLDDKQPPIDLAPLIELGKQVEALFGQPQDIEWAYHQGRFLLLQARDITVSIKDGGSPRNLQEKERSRLLDIAQGESVEEPVFVQDALSELLPRPTPLSLSFMGRLWEVDGSTELACHELAVPYKISTYSKPYVVSAFGALYVNQAEGSRRIGKGPGAVAAFKLARNAEQLDRDFTHRFLPVFMQRMRRHEVMDLSRLKLEELVELYERWSDDFVRNTYVEAELINVAANFYWQTARKELEQHGEDPALHLGGSEATVVSQAMGLLPEIRAGKRDRAEFLELFGHRAPNDYELAQPRYAEDSEQLDALIQRSSSAGHESDEKTTAPLPDKPVLALSIKRARRFQVLKEEAKHHCLRQLANIRRVLLEIGQQSGLGQDLFQLTYSEVLELAHSAGIEQAEETVTLRIKQNEAWASIQLPASLTLTDLERLDVDNAAALSVRQGQELRGTKVSGQGEVIGTVQVIDDPEDIGNFKKGNILVARFTDPTWTPLFDQASGLITEVGGWLSHAAIVAREYGLTAIVGVNGALSSLANGQLVRLSEDGMVEPMSTRRNNQRTPLSLPVDISNQATSIQGTLRNMSLCGAYVETDETLEVGQQLALALTGNRPWIEFEVVRPTNDGYGLRFVNTIGDDLYQEVVSECAA